MNEFKELMRRLLRSKPLYACLAVVVAAGIVAGCGGDDDGGDNGGSATETTAEEGGGTTPVSMALSFPRSIYWSPLLVAESEGYFDEAGVDVSVEETEGSGFVTQQVIAGNVDIGWAAAPDSVVAYSKDDTLRALMCNPPRNIFQIVVPEGSDITSIEQLEGQTLGITTLGGGEVPVVNAALADAGLEPGEDVDIQPIGEAGPQAVNALQNDMVQAYATSYIDLSVLTAEDGIEFTEITPEEYAVIPGDCMVVKQETLDDPDMREAVLGVARAWAQGTVFMESNPDATLAIGCEAVPEECQNMAFAEQFISDTLTLFEPAEEGLPIGVVPDEAWVTTKDLLRDTNTIQGDPDVETFAFSPEVKEFQDEYMDFDQEEIRSQAEAAAS